MKGLWMMFPMLILDIDTPGIKVVIASGFRYPKQRDLMSKLATCTSLDLLIAKCVVIKEGLTFGKES